MQEQQFTIYLDELKNEQNKELLSPKHNQFFKKVTFTPHPFPVTPAEIRDYNLRHLGGIIKEKVKRYLNKKQQWNTQNLQETCHEVAQHFKGNKCLQRLKDKLEVQHIDSQNEFFSGISIRSHSNLINIKESFNKIEQGMFNNLSQHVNLKILFFYDAVRDSIVVKYAKYHQNDDNQGLKIIPILRCALDERLSTAVWLKDRKGDIFAFHNGSLFIFKYHLKQKQFKQIQLRKHESFSKIRNRHSIVYIPQTDRIYYFDEKQFNASFYVQLYRPYREQKQFSNSLSANLPRPVILFSNIKMTPFRATYILELRNGKVIPVIYLLFYRKNYLPVPLSIIRVFYDEKSKAQVEELYSDQGDMDQDEVELNFTEGVLSVFRRDQCSILSFYCLVNNNRTIIEGKIVNMEIKAKVEWNLHPATSIFSLCHQKAQYRKNLNLPVYSSLSQVPEKVKNEIFLLNDLEGQRSNNSSRFQIYQPDKDQYHELIIDITEGHYLSRFFDSH